VVATKGYQDYPGLGWRVAAHKPVDVIYSPANHLMWQIIAVGVAAVAAASALAWFVAGTVAKPLQRLSEQLDDIGRRSGAMSVERQHGSEDVLHLSAAIRSLLRRVGAAEAEQQASSSAIEALKQELDTQVKASEERTMRLGADIHALRVLADTDALTGLLNRRAFLPYAEDALSYYRRYDRPFSILMFDIDHFKRINDTFGHAAGDEVIRAVGNLISQEIRSTDKFARFGGEEFVLLLRETDVKIAADLADRLRQKIQSLRVTSGDRSIAFTVSVGCAVSDQTGRDVEDFIQRADQALYAAKAAGRNNVKSFQEQRVQDRAVA
jgi:diguanylate cyclase (GGDEF)-like protein